MMSLYPVVFGITATFIGAFAQKAGRKNIVILG
jgi:hypothetical protein